MNNSTHRNVTFDLEITYAGETITTRMKELLHRKRYAYFRATKTVKVKFDPQTKVAVLNE